MRRPVLPERILSSLARKHGTPLYVYSQQRILDKLTTLQDAFSMPLHVHFAMKANNFPPVLKLLSKNKTGVDVVSAGEINRALECGFKPQKIIFSGVGKSVEEITLALRKEIFSLNVEGPQELERIGLLAKRLRKKAGVSFRLNPNVNPKTHPYITTGFRNNKFGMDKSFLPLLLKTLNKYKKNISLLGLDFHIGSQLTEIAPIEEALVKSIPIYKDLQGQGFPLSHFDIGGGIGISYEGQKTINLNDYAKRLEKHLRPLGCQIMCEPGRYLVADAGVLLTEVEYIKKTPFKNFVIVNTGMHHLIRPALYQAYHEIQPLKNTGRKKFKADVVGPICESADYLAQDRMLPEVKQGEILCIYDAGAYGQVMASHYNLHPMPREVLV